MIGKTVGKYRILERLGRGGMGIVYKALDETLDRVVAIKVLNPDLSDAELLKRFRSEAISLARLNHPGIATIYELHRHDDESADGDGVRARRDAADAVGAAGARSSRRRPTHVCVQILDALTHAHGAGMIHRDLKPANVMVTDTGVVKVMDFGIARMLGGEHFTQTGYMMGTPAYMAPEQVLGQEIDGRADLYSVGVLFYRLLSRELPFKADTAISMAQKQIARSADCRSATSVRTCPRGARRSSRRRCRRRLTSVSRPQRRSARAHWRQSHLQISAICRRWRRRPHSI